MRVCNAEAVIRAVVPRYKWQDLSEAQREKIFRLGPEASKHIMERGDTLDGLTMRDGERQPTRHRARKWLPTSHCHLRRQSDCLLVTPRRGILKMPDAPANPRHPRPPPRLRHDVQLKLADASHRGFPSQNRIAFSISGRSCTCPKSFRKYA